MKTTTFTIILTSLFLTTTCEVSAVSRNFCFNEEDVKEFWQPAVPFSTTNFSQVLVNGEPQKVQQSTVLKNLDQKFHFDEEEAILFRQMVAPKPQISSTDKVKKFFQGINNCSLRFVTFQACNELDPKQKSAFNKSTIDLFQRVPDFYRSFIIKACKDLTPDQIEKRFKAITVFADDLFHEVNGEPYVRANVIIICLKLAPTDIQERLNTIKEYEGIFPIDCAKERMFEICLKLTPNQMEAIAENADVLFKKTKTSSKRLKVIEACESFTPIDIKKHSKLIASTYKDKK